MAENQAYLFVIFTFVGMIIGILFDFFRILRKTFKTKDIITYIEDIIFWIMTGIIIIHSMYKFCDGELRFFMIIGIVLGTAIYMLTISRYVIIISLSIIKIIIVTLIYPIKTLFEMTKKIIFKPIVFICINLRKKFVKNTKKNRGFFIKKEKYNSIKKIT